MIDKKILNNMCFSCGSCKSICPSNAISMKRNSFGFEYPVIDETKCTNCEKCINHCPALNNDFKKKHEIEKALMLKSKYSTEAASGGVFSNLAKYIISQGGYVAGTIWNAEFLPEIILTNDYDCVAKMRGSKYVASSTGNSYANTKTLLDKEITVLYSGVPCQIAGLYKFLNKDYNNLITVELLCHGVGSPLAWKKYLEFAKQKYGKSIIDYKCQNSKQKITITFEDNTNTVESSRTNEYRNAYMQNKFHKDSCFKCPYRGRVRNGDIIIGDIWAKWAEEYRKNGISLAIINSTRGEQLIDRTEWEIKEGFNINDKLNEPLNKINNKPSLYNSDRTVILNSLSKGLSFESAIKNNKVALMNFNYPRDNYGALLLAYAMEKIVKKFDYEPYTINYYKNPVTMNFNPQGETWKFREKFLNLYGFFLNKDDLLQLNDEFDKFIFGSDVIWRENREYVYFADWVSGNKNIIAYAGSFGENKPIAENNYKRTCFKRFDSISVRESASIKMLSDFADIKAEFVIDPTLLLTKDEYRDIMESEIFEIPEYEYVAYYSFWKFNPYNLDIKLPKINILKDDFNNTRSFAQWLNLIKYAKYVVTTSFHGVCFSLLFNKPFIFVKKPREDNERVKSLLKKFEINSNRIVGNEKDITLDLIQETIDWIKVNNIMQEFRKFSAEWLKSALEKEPVNKNKLYDNKAKENIVTQKIKLSERIFSVKNEYRNNTKHKIIRLLGIKFSKKITPKIKVILKFDDLLGYAYKDAKITLAQMEKIIKDKKLKVSWGIIGKYLETPDKDIVINYIKSHKTNKNYHFFNHGYSHLVEHPDKYEFYNQSVDNQVESIKKTQELVYKYTGVVLDTFGAPANKIDKNTVKALEANKDIKYWYFGLKNDNICNIEVNGYKNCIENGTYNVDFEYMKQQLSDKHVKKDKIIILQCHPLGWRDEHFKEFVKCIDYLKNENGVFITPKEIKNGNAL